MTCVQRTPRIGHPKHTVCARSNLIDALCLAELNVQEHTPFGVLSFSLHYRSPHYY